MSQTFAKAHDELVERGVPIRVVVAYGKLEFMARNKGECWPTHSTLAKLLGLKSDRQVRRILKELQRLRLIEWKRERYYCRYRTLAPDVQLIANLIANPDRTKMSDLTGQKSPISDRTKMSDRKESSSSKRSTEKNLFPPKPAGAATAKPKPTAQPPRANPDGSHPKNFDDDDPNLTPEQRFEARLRKRHGVAFPATTTIKTALKELANYPGVTFRDFLEFDKERTTGTHFRNPGGYYRKLAEECGRQREGEMAKAHMAANAAGAEVPLNDKGRCLKCGGPGKLKDGGYCDCPTGKDLERAMRPKPKSKTRSRVDYGAL